ncbi:MAG: MqnA/MqnD/SBP family protein, partial [Planctomycetota bacterium]
EFEIELLDIEQLNQRLFSGGFDVAKCSFHAAIRMAESIYVMPTGSALGFGVGPLLLASQPEVVPESTSQLTLCPGELTTATLLYNLFYPSKTRLEHVVFSDIMPSLSSRRADFGVCIHEGRFTWQQEGLALVEDLGSRWERETECPLPLGGLVGDRALPTTLLQNVNQIIQDSLQLARSNPEATLPTMRRYAQEFDDEVLMKHVELYVNDWTIDLGDQGANSLAQLAQKSADAGILEPSQKVLEILPS